MNVSMFVRRWKCGSKAYRQCLRKKTHTKKMNKIVSLNFSFTTRYLSVLTSFLPSDVKPILSSKELSFCSALISINNLSSLPEMFCKKGVLKNFAKFTGKHLCQSLFFNKVVGAAFL